MAAYAALTSLMRVIHDLETHPSPPISLDKQLLDSITQRIAFFEEFLHDYISHDIGDDDEEEEAAAADPLEMRIAAAAYAAEDAIEYHIVDCVKPKKKNYRDLQANDDEKMESMKRCCGILQSVIEEMDSIKKVLMTPEYYYNDQVMTTSSVRINNIINPAAVAVAPNEISLVGSDDAVLEIMEKLAGGQLDCQVIPIVGMGGIGKTFLAKTIYTKPLIKEHFDISAWATISQQYNTREILCEVLSQATSREKEQLMSGKSVDELGLELHKHLFSRRFLIVMDDMWSIDSWDKIQRFFPNNGNGSRVLVTTRLSQLSLQLNNNDYSLRMSFLDEASSWDLFSKTVFGEKSSSCPAELKEIGEKIVDNCRGLPLSIAVVGGLLKNMDATRASWESIRDNFSSAVNMDNNQHCLRLLRLSYNHLPVYLKPCFLYLGGFEEDEEIHVATLVQLWVSEGFLKPKTNGETLETTARGFLHDLVDRNLVLIGRVGSTGSLKICKMHDLVRDMCLKECDKQEFYRVVGGRSNRGGGQRRVVIPNNTWMENVRGELRFMSRTRSILSERGVVALCRNLVLLRTFQMLKKSRGAEKNFDLTSLVSRYVNLRHVSIGAPGMSWLLPSVSRLWNLRTLIVSYCFLDEPVLVADFWKLTQLRCMEFNTSYVYIPDPAPINCVVMENLHTLKGVSNFKCSEEMVKSIPNIKRLRLEYNRYYVDETSSADEDDDVYLMGNLEKFSGLEFLSITFLDKSPITCVQNISFPHHLKKLGIYLDFEFEWDQSLLLEKIGSLPLLEKLRFKSVFSGEGNKWEIAEEQFPSLKYLEVFFCDGLVSWTASEEDSSILPSLEHLSLDCLKQLKMIPFELGNIDTLKRIQVRNCGEEVVKIVKEMFDEQAEFQGGEDQLSFHVEVDVSKDQHHLLSLACPNFYVTSI